MCPAFWQSVDVSVRQGTFRCSQPGLGDKEYTCEMINWESGALIISEE